MKKYESVPVEMIGESLFLNDDGLVIWGERPRSHFASDSSYKRYITLFKGKEYGYISDGYRYGSLRVGDKNRRLLYHVAKWVLVYGSYPDGVIDHKDGNGLNNCIENLQDVTHKINARNAKRRCDNTSGVNGVHWNTKYNKWHVQGYETIKGKTTNKYLGCYDSLSIAALVRLEWEQSIGCSERHGKENVNA